MLILNYQLSDINKFVHVFLRLRIIPFLFMKFVVQHREFAKRKKRIANELYDKEKLSDSFLVIGESYQKLRNFDKALKWYRKSWETYKSINNFEVSLVSMLCSIVHLLKFMT